jgi:hypothetical protein
VPLLQTSSNCGFALPWKRYLVLCGEGEGRGKKGGRRRDECQTIIVWA